MNESILFDILQKSKDTKQILSIWKYNDDDGFWAGYVKDFNSEFVVIHHYTKFGQYDGVIIENIENIKSVDFNDDYAKMLQYVVDNAEVINKQDDFEIKISESDNWQEKILKQVEGNTDIVVSVEINGSDHYSGFIEVVSKTDFVLRGISKFGEDEGKSIYKLNDVTTVRIDEIEDRKRKLLYNWRKSSL